jgi:hypothetical protein
MLFMILNRLISAELDGGGQQIEAGLLKDKPR